MPQAIPDFIDAATPTPTGELQQLRALVAAARAQQLTKQDLEERLTELNKALRTLFHEQLPELMVAANVKSLTLEATGNSPEIKAELAPYYKAAIPASWPEAQRAAAFKWLDENGHGDLIQTTVTVTFPRARRAAALSFARTLEAQGYAPAVKEDVHWATLTAWLREQVENDNPPPLDIIGGMVGRVVTLK